MWSNSHFSVFYMRIWQNIYTRPNILKKGWIFIFRMYPIVFFHAEQEYGILFTLSCQSEFLKPNEISLFYDSTVRKKIKHFFVAIWKYYTQMKNIKVLITNMKLVSWLSLIDRSNCDFLPLYVNGQNEFINEARGYPHWWNILFDDSILCSFLHRPRICHS